MSGRTLSATLSLTNGAVLGTYGASGSYGISVASGGKLVSIGSPTLLNRIVRYNTVQEQANTNWSSSTAGMSIRTYHATAQVQCRFTAWSLLGNAGYHLNAYTAALLNFQDCQLGGGYFYAFYNSGGGITNCLWERVISEAGGDNAPFYMYNNLVRGGRWTWTIYSNGWIVRDNTFDSCILNEQEYPVVNDHNAYIGISPLGSSGGSDKTLTNADYQVGPLGTYYYPTNGGQLSTLINAGSRDALSAGLYQYMTTTNEVPEMSSTVDIGFHYGYPIDVSEDLLLIYNTNSADSSNVWYYYMVNRPLVGQANVLGIGCTTNETFLPDEYTNVFAAQVQNWLAQNPTKRPQYVVLFPDIPSRVNTNNTPKEYSNMWNPGGPYPPYPQRQSVQYQFYAWCDPDWHPFVSSINMGDTNACMAYIDKLRNLGSHGQVVLSASAGGYCNTNYIVDNVRFYDEEQYSVVSVATNGLVSAGVPESSIHYLGTVERCAQWLTNVVDGKTNFVCLEIAPEDHITNGVNVAGYICWGIHSTLTIGTPFIVDWTDDSGWWLIETIESANGQRWYGGPGLFLNWFSSPAFGGTNYSHTPVGAVTHVDEPTTGGVNNSATYFYLWARGANFANCAWQSRNTWYFQAVGDPLVMK